MNRYLYPVTVILLMFIFPLVSVIIELLSGSQDSIFLLLGKWIVFWGIGMRLFTAGLRQIIKPELTSEGILKIEGKAAWQLVRELGFANVGIGLVGIISLWITGWAAAAGLAGGLFLTFAGLEHIRKANKNSEEVLAMLSDLFVGLIGLIYAVTLLVSYFSA